MTREEEAKQLAAQMLLFAQADGKNPKLVLEALVWATAATIHGSFTDPDLAMKGFVENLPQVVQAIADGKNRLLS